jgi:hypothetical protein
MAREWTKYLTGVALGLALFAAGCEKKGEDAGPQSTLGLASPSTPEQSGTGEGAVAPNPGYEQGSPGASKDQNSERTQKSQPG